MKRHPSDAGSEGSAIDGRHPVTVLWVMAGYLMAVVAASVTGAVGAAVGADGPDSPAALLSGQAGFWVVLIGTVVLAQRRGAAVWGGFAREVWARDLVVGVVVGVATQLVLLPALYLPLRSVIDVDELSAPAEDLLGGLGGASLIAIGIGVVFVAPVVEELFFRGLLLRALAARWSMATGVIGSAVIFGATHFQPLQFPGLVLAGLVFAGAVVRAGRLGASIAVHVGFNATTFLLLTMV